MKIIERLHQYIETKQISLNSFDVSIGASNGYIGKQIKNKASIGGDVIEKIVKIYTDLNLYWLITGEGEMFKKSEPVIIKTEQNSDNATLIVFLKDQLKEKDKEIGMLKEEVGSLKKEVEFLKKNQKPALYSIAAEP